MRLQTTSGFNESYEAFFDSCSDDSRKFSIILGCPLHFIWSPLIIFKYLSVMLLCFDLEINVHLLVSFPTTLVLSRPNDKVFP